jgi:hypothetical protein
MTFSTSKCNGNVVETIAGNPNFSPSDGRILQ